MSNESSPIPEFSRVTRGAGFNFAGALSRNILGFIVVFVLAKMLSPSEMGLFFLGLNIISFAGIIGIAGLDAGIRRFISIAHGARDDAAAWYYFGTAVAISAAFSTVLATILFLGAGHLGEVIFKKPELSAIIRAFTPYLIFYVAAELLLAATQAYKHMKYRVLCLDVLNSVMRIALALLFMFLGFTLYGAISAYVISIFIASALAFYYFLKIMPPRPSGKLEYRFRIMTSFSLPTSLARVLASGTGIFETIILGYFVIAGQIGIYTVAMKITAIGAIVLASLNMVFTPLISQLYAQNRMDELRELYKTVTRWAFTLSLPVFMLMAWYSIPIVAFFGQEYIGGAVVIAILCGGQLINAATGPAGNVLLMSGHSLTTLWINLLGLCLTIALCIILIPEYGIAGCAVAVASAVAIMNIVRVIMTIVFIKMQPYDIHYWKPLASASLTLALLATWGPAQGTLLSAPNLLLTMAIGILVYGISLYMFGLNNADRYVLDKIRHKLIK